MIDIRQLRYFQAVAEDLHFGRAAARLAIAQPALSRQIQQLEQELGTPLLRRTQRRVELLPAGALLLERSRAIQQELARTLADVRRTGAGELGKLTLGFIHSSTYGLLPTVIRRFRQLYPGIELELHELPITTQLASLVRGTIDLGLLRVQPAPPELEIAPVMADPFVLAVPAKHRLAARARVRLKELAGEPFIMFVKAEAPLLHDRVQALCEQAGFSPDVVQRATQLHTIVGLVGGGLGVAVLPASARNLHPRQVRFLQIADRAEPLHIALAWRRGQETPAIRSFRKVTQDVVASLMP